MAENIQKQFIDNANGVSFYEVTFTHLIQSPLLLEDYFRIKNIIENEIEKLEYINLNKK